MFPPSIDDVGRPIIYNFAGLYDSFSNFSDHRAYYEGINYPTSEHAFAAAKTLVPEKKIHISHQRTPGKAKHEGRLVELRPDWEVVKYRVMHDIVLAKFTQNHGIGVILKSTDAHWVIEGNQHNDQIWGCTLQGGRWIGNNFLGMILMAVRDNLLAHPASMQWKNYGCLPWFPPKNSTVGLDCFH